MIQTELKSEKVELAVDDYDKFLKELLSINKDLRNEVGNYVSLKNKIIAIRRNVSKLSFKASGILKESEKLATQDLKKAKELGVNANIITKPYQQIKKDVNDIEKKAERVIQETGKIR
jgi:hypothetical protein